MIISSEEYRSRKICAARLRLMFAQGENPIGGPRTDVCPAIAECYEIEHIKNLESEIICDLNAVIKYDTMVAKLRAKSSAVGTTLTLLLYKYHPLNWAKDRDILKFI